jgi:hypothetical protein
MFLSAGFAIAVTVDKKFMFLSSGKWLTLRESFWIWRRPCMGILQSRQTNGGDDMRLADFLCIGAQKSATGWLNTMLRQHPNIWMPPIKELHFFDRMTSKNRKLRARHMARIEGKRQRESEGAPDSDWAAYLQRIAAFDEICLPWYQAMFSWPTGTDVKRGEITPAYFEIPGSSVRYARDLLGDIKIMAIIRRPIDRELSQLRMSAARRSRKGAGPETAEDWMKIYDSMVKEFARGSYSIGIPRWQAAFSEKNFLAIPFADVREEPLMMMTRVEHFLEIPNFGLYKMLNKKIHKTKKAEIPPEVMARAADRVSAEDKFLINHFGEEFFKRTK